MRKIIVLDGYCLNPGDQSWEPLRALGELEVYDRTAPDLLIQRASGASALLTNKTAISGETLRQLPDLRYIGVLATGYNVVDVSVATELGIAVTNIPAYGTHSVAQLAIALLLELCHHAGEHSQAVHRGEWTSNPDWSFWRSPLVELAGKVFGVIGMGRIGSRTAAIAEALGMQVISHSRGGGVPLEPLLSESDVVSLHCPLTPETQDLINAARLKRMKTSAFLINTSRGPLIDEQDLADALNGGIIAGAALDVLREEPPVHGSPLLQAKNCIITPHLAWATVEARTRLLGVAVENLQAFFEGTPRNRVA